MGQGLNNQKPQLGVILVREVRVSLKIRLSNKTLYKHYFVRLLRILNIDCIYPFHKHLSSLHSARESDIKLSIELDPRHNNPLIYRCSVQDRACFDIDNTCGG